MMVSGCVVAYRQIQSLSDFVVRKLCTVVETFLTLVVSDNTRDMDVLVKVGVGSLTLTTAYYTFLATSMSVINKNKI